MLGHQGAVLAHQGGWDELLMVLVPIAALIGLLAIAKRRADRGEQTDQPGRPDDGG